MNQSKREKYRLRGTPSKNTISSHHVYTGSPDSETVAGYLDSFIYEPKRTDEVLRKYET